MKHQSFKTIINYFLPFLWLKIWPRPLKFMFCTSMGQTRDLKLSFDFDLSAATTGMLSEQIHIELCLWDKPLMMWAIILNRQVPGRRVSQNWWSSQPTLPTGFAIFQRNRIIETKPEKVFFAPFFWSHIQI